MPRLTRSIPSYRKHRASGQAIVTLNGRDFYLGPYSTKVSRAEYDRLVGQWLQHNVSGTFVGRYISLRSESGLIAVATLSDQLKSVPASLKWRTSDVPSVFGDRLRWGMAFHFRRRGFGSELFVPFGSSQSSLRHWHLLHC
jgi:hypothetical protein